ncbi:IS3 family transposase [uncultured Fusobacterium sp.]
MDKKIIYRIIEKLKGLTPIQYKNQSLLINV